MSPIYVYLATYYSGNYPPLPVPRVEEQNIDQCHLGGKYGKEEEKRGNYYYRRNQGQSTYGTTNANKNKFITVNSSKKTDSSSTFNLPFKTLQKFDRQPFNRCFNAIKKKIRLLWKNLRNHQGMNINNFHSASATGF
jgi:hypothetical protein